MSFSDREQAFERKFEHDENLQFRVTVRRNKLLGLWAASRMGLSGDAAEAYAKEVISSDFEEVGDHDVIRKVMGDLNAKGLDYSEHRVRKHLDECLAEAKQQVMKE